MDQRSVVRDQAGKLPQPGAGSPIGQFLRQREEYVQGVETPQFGSTDFTREMIMQRIQMHAVFLLVGLAALGSAVAHAQTDVALSIYGAFNGTTNGNGTAQSPSNSAGGIVELRHISNPIVGYEATYSFNRANENYSSCGIVSPICSEQSVKADAHEITADWVASVKLANLRPFALAGVGLLLNVPGSGQTSTSTSTKPVFIYGAGLDWGLVPHIGLRLQYRGNLYRAPNLTKLFTSTDAFAHTAEPMIGAYFRF
jgi:opacity protein-like surface antigen